MRTQQVLRGGVGRWSFAVLSAAAMAGRLLGQAAAPPPWQAGPGASPSGSEPFVFFYVSADARLLRKEAVERSSPGESH